MSVARLSSIPVYSVENNPYQAIYLDLTCRCNMTCSFCYNSENENPADMEVEYFEDVCSRLPAAVYFRFLGGEPALHPHFFDFIRIGSSFGHHVQFSSNGLIYNDDSFLSRLKNLQYPVVASMTLDGGYSSRESYIAINGEDHLDAKLQALENLNRHGIKRVALTAIIARGINEQTVPELFELADKYKEIVRFIHFRTAARIGSFIDTEPYSLEELKSLVAPYFTADELQPRCIGEIHCPPIEGRGCCFRFRPTRRLQVSLIEFASDRSANCHKRGKLLDDYKIAPLFAHMRR